MSGRAQHGSIGEGADGERGAGPLHCVLSLAALLGRREEPALLGASWVGQVLPAGLGTAALPLQQIAAPLLGGDAAAPVEAWFGAGACRDGVAHGVHFRCDGQLLFGVISVSEHDFPAAGAVSPLQLAGLQAYQNLFRVLAGEGYPHLWRVWNYFDDINGGADGLERYRQFNLGRHQAFAAAGRLHAESIPAASALGLAGGGPLRVAFLAARAPSVALENPRQLSAYAYPADYGPCSPTFSRAALARVRGQEWLLVSGTASIVGHRSVHPGDAAAQTREILANLAALLGEASRVSRGPAYRLDELGGRVYVRHPEDLATVQAELRRALGPAAPILYICADICRAELLVEFEAQACHLFE